MKTQLRKFNTELQVERTETFEDGKAVFEGFFIVYNSPAPCKPFDYSEQIAPEAVLKSLEKNDIRCLFNHNSDIVLGRTGNGTLKLENRQNGLYGICELNLKDSQARDAYERVKRGDISGCSFGAFIKNEDYDQDRKLWTIRDLDILEVSVCSIPFYENTTMEARSRTETLEKLSQKETADELKIEFIKRRVKKWL